MYAQKSVAQQDFKGILSQIQPSQISIEQLRRLTEQITVRIPAPKSWGSGILINKQGNIYTVLTNHHVIKSNTSYQIQTADGQTHNAELVQTLRFGDNDLAVLTFRSNNAYTVASFGNSSTLEIGEEVVAGGFPFDQELTGSRGFLFTTGQISLFSNKTFAGGYQLGYTNPIEKGMSGGPVLNSKGQLIGVNGIHAYPLWGNPYVFSDGTSASPLMQEQMSRYSWAIPIQTYIELAMGNTRPQSRPVLNINQPQIEINNPENTPSFNNSPQPISQPENQTPSPVPPEIYPIQETLPSVNSQPVPLW
nr:serine protease [Ancylothrix sp. D3o]